MKMKKMLVISEYFAPMNRIAAIRFTKLVKYISRLQLYDITVITKKSKEPISDPILRDDRMEFEKTCKIIEVDTEDSMLPTFDLTKYTGEKLNYLSLLNNISMGITFQNKGWEALVRQKKTKFDIVISTFGDYGGLFLGEKLKKQNPKSIWIADFRDAIIGTSFPAIIQKIALNYSNRISKKADLITLVTPMDDKQVVVKNKSKKIILTNGYDLEDLKYLNKSQQDGFFHIVYTGSIYENDDFDAFFNALSDLGHEKSIDLSDLKIDYAGKQFKVFSDYARKYNLVEHLENHGYLNRTESLNLQNKANILLVAIWNTKDSRNIVTGKVYEYLMMNKSILSLVSGDRGNSLLKRLINKCNAGFCYEEANKQNDYNLMKEYLLQQYTSLFLKEADFGGIQSVKNKNISQFDYKNIAQKLVNILESIKSEDI